MEEKFESAGEDNNGRYNTYLLNYICQIFSIFYFIFMFFILLFICFFWQPMKFYLLLKHSPIVKL